MDIASQPGRAAAAMVGAAALVVLAVLAGLLVTGHLGSRTLTGAVTIVESEMAKFDRDVHGAMADATSKPPPGGLARCLAIAATFDMAPGHPVVLYDETGAVIGHGILGQGEPPWVADQPAADDALCRLPFVVDRVKSSQTVSVEIGSQRMTYPSTELDARAWDLEVTVGS